MAETATTPVQYLDVLYQQKTEQGERVLFPITRFSAVIGAPKVLTDMNEANNVPFVLHVSDTSNDY